MSVFTLRHAVKVGVGAVGLGVTWHGTRYVRESYGTGRRFLRKKYEKEYNPLEQSAYSGDKEGYAEHLHDIHRFNTNRKRSFLLRKAFATPIDVPHLFRVANIDANLTAGNMPRVIDAEAYDLLTVFFNKVYKDRMHDQDVATGVDDMFRRSIETGYYPYINTYNMHLSRELTAKVGDLTAKVGTLTERVDALAGAGTGAGAGAGAGAGNWGEGGGAYVPPFG